MNIKTYQFFIVLSILAIIGCNHNKNDDYYFYEETYTIKMFNLYHPEFAIVENNQKSDKVDQLVLFNSEGYDPFTIKPHRINDGKPLIDYKLNSDSTIPCIYVQFLKEDHYGDYLNKAKEEYFRGQSKL